MRTVQSGRILVVLLVMIGLTGTSSADHSWDDYHWKKTSSQVSLLVGYNVSSGWDEYLDEAIADWSESKYIQLTKTSGGTKPKSCRPTEGRIEVCSASYGNNGWLGIAQIWLSGGHIVQGTTKMNDYYFNRSGYNTPAWRKLVMCQEIAHDFGLDHQDEDFDNPNLGSCMDYTSDPDGPPSNEHPDSHDFEELETIYNHTHTAPQLHLRNVPPPAFRNLDLPSRGQWGKLLRSSVDGRVQVYMLDFGEGNIVITHVFWARPRVIRPSPSHNTRDWSKLHLGGRAPSALPALVVKFPNIVYRITREFEHF